MPKDIKKLLLKADELKNGKELALAKEFIDITENVDTVIGKIDSISDEIKLRDQLKEIQDKEENKKEVEISKINGVEMITLKGEKGDTPQKGKDYFTDEEVKSFLNKITPVKGKDYFDGKQGPQGPEGKQGPQGPQGPQGDPGINGRNGKDGRDGSPDTAEQIVEKLESLTEESRLDASAIKNLPEFIQGDKRIGFGSMIKEAPKDDKYYVRQNRQWVESPAGGSGGTWGSITGTLSNQTDLQNALNLKYDASNPAGYITASALSGYTPTSRTITINGTAHDLSADRTWSVGTVTSVAALTLGTTGTDLSSTVATGTTTPVITLNVPTASATNRGALSSTDWTTFNNKFSLPAFTSGSVPFSDGTTLAQDNANLFWNKTTKSLGIGTTNTSFAGYDPKLVISGNGTGVNGRTTFIVKNNSADSASVFFLTNSNGKFVGVQASGPSYVIGEAGGIFTSNMNLYISTDGSIPNGGTSKIFFTTGGWSNNPTMTITPGNPGNVGMGGVSNPTARLHLSAGTATASTAPLKFTAGTNLTTAEAGAMEYNNTPHFTNSDATRRHIVLSPSATKTTAGAPYTNDGYITINIGGTDFKVMTTA